MGYDGDLRQRAVQLYLEGTSQRAISRLLSVNHQSVANWIAQHHHRLPAQVTDTTPTETIEVDELVTFVGKKRITSILSSELPETQD
jgi:transposase-like protein